MTQVGPGLHFVQYTDSYMASAVGTQVQSGKHHGTASDHHAAREDARPKAAVMKSYGHLANVSASSRIVGFMAPIHIR